MLLSPAPRGAHLARLLSTKRLRTWDLPYGVTEAAAHVVAELPANAATHDRLSGGHYGYRASKAGLNAIARSLAIDLFPRGVTVVLLHPGWVNTAGGAVGAQVPAEESVAGMLNVISRLGNHDTGQFYTFTGQPLPW